MQTSEKRYSAKLKVVSVYHDRHQNPYKTIIQKAPEFLYRIFAIVLVLSQLLCMLIAIIIRFDIYHSIRIGQILIYLS